MVADFSRWCVHPTMQPPISATHPHLVTLKNRSLTNETPARRGSQTALTWAALQLRVEVNYHSPTARAPLTSHPRTTLNVVDTPFKASQADAFLVGTPSCSSHDLTPKARQRRGLSDPPRWG